MPPHISTGRGQGALQTHHHMCRSDRGHSSGCAPGRRVPESLRRHKEHPHAGGPAPGDLISLGDGGVGRSRAARFLQDPPYKPAGPAWSGKGLMCTRTENTVTDSLLQDGELTLPLQLLQPQFPSALGMLSRAAAPRASQPGWLCSSHLASGSPSPPTPHSSSLGRCPSQLATINPFR